jgi:hypothetical protein
MNTNTQRNEYVTRDTIMKLLSDEEVARVSTLEAGPSLARGDQYVDLKRLNKGILHMEATTLLSMGDVLPRAAVADKTWMKICALLIKRFP